MLIISRRGRDVTAIPLSAIMRAEAVDGGWNAINTRGETERVSDIDWDIALALTVQSTFPAAPGTFALMVVEDENGGKEVHRSAVLGWGIYADGETRPITLDQEADRPYTIEFADGHVETTASLDRWPDAATWLAEEACK